MRSLLAAAGAALLATAALAPVSAQFEPQTTLYADDANLYPNCTFSAVQVCLLPENEVPGLPFTVGSGNATAVIDYETLQTICLNAGAYGGPGSTDQTVQLAYNLIPVLVSIANGADATIGNITFWINTANEILTTFPLFSQPAIEGEPQLLTEHTANALFLWVFGTFGIFPCYPGDTNITLPVQTPAPTTPVPTITPCPAVTIESVTPANATLSSQITIIGTGFTTGAPTVYILDSLAYRYTCSNPVVTDLGNGEDEIVCTLPSYVEGSSVNIYMTNGCATSGAYVIDAVSAATPTPTPDATYVESVTLTPTPTPTSSPSGPGGIINPSWPSNTTIQPNSTCVYTQNSYTYANLGTQSYPCPTLYLGDQQFNTSILLEIMEQGSGIGSSDQTVQLSFNLIPALENICNICGANSDLNEPCDAAGGAMIGQYIQNAQLILTTYPVFSHPSLEGQPQLFAENTATALFLYNLGELLVIPGHCVDETLPTATPTPVPTTGAPTTAPSSGESVSNGTASAPSGSVASAGCPDGNSVCYVYDPLRSESPWAGSKFAYPQCYDPTLYTCSTTQQFLCPLTAPFVCGRNCYNGAQYHCQQNTTDRFASVLLQGAAPVLTGATTNFVAVTTATSAPSTTGTTTSTSGASSMSASLLVAAGATAVAALML